MAEYEQAADFDPDEGKHASDRAILDMSTLLPCFDPDNQGTLTWGNSLHR